MAHRQLATGKFRCVEKFGCVERLGVSKSLGVSKTALNGSTAQRPFWHPTPPLGAGRPVGVWRRVRTPCRQNMSSRGTMVVWSPGVPRRLPRYIYPSGPQVVPDCPSTARPPGVPRYPARLPHARAPPPGPTCPRWRPPTDPLWVCRKMAHRQLANFECVERPTVNWRVWACRKRPRCPFRALPAPRLRVRCARAPKTRAVDWRVPPPTSPPAPRPGGPRRRPVGPAGWHPPPRRLPRLEGRPPRTETAGTRGRGPQHASTAGPPAWPVAPRLVSLRPTRPLRLARRRNRPSSRAP